MGESSEAHGPGSLVYIRNDDNSKRGSVLNKTEGKGLLENSKLKKKIKGLSIYLKQQMEPKESVKAQCLYVRPLCCLGPPRKPWFRAEGTCCLKAKGDQLILAWLRQ